MVLARKQENLRGGPSSNQVLHEPGPLSFVQQADPLPTSPWVGRANEALGRRAGNIHSKETGARMCGAVQIEWLGAKRGHLEHGTCA